MKRGFALLETIIVITFLAVSLLLLYGVFQGMVTKSKDNVLYDNVSEIYKAFYLKEYLELDNLKPKGDITLFKCSLVDNKNCSYLIKKFDIHALYLTKYDLKDYNEEDYTSTFNNYVASLSNKGDYKYRLIVEFNNKNTYSYASLGIGEENE